MIQLSAPVLPLLDGALDAQLPGLVDTISRAAPLLIPYHLRSAIASLPRDLPYIILAPPASCPAEPASGALTAAGAADLLDAGAEALITADTELVEQLPADRVLLLIDHASAIPLPEYAQKVAGVLVTLPQGAEVQGAQVGELIDGFAKALKSKDTGKPVYVLPGGMLDEVHRAASNGASAQASSSIKAPTPADVARLASLASSLVVPTSALTLSADASGAKLDLIDAFLAPLQSDRSDGLFPTLVVAASSSASLGLVYSSRESVRESLTTGAAVYQSRTRGLWRKGATSGATQAVVRVRIDCDADALEVCVRQKRGTGFCHLTQRDGCFGSLTGIARLEQTLVERKASAPAGSYTARLFSDPALLGAKLREEAAELADAKSEDKEHVAFEAADLLYFALARCVAANVGLEDIERSLEAKAKKVSRRKGDAKPQYAKEQAAASAAATPAQANGTASKAATGNTASDTPADETKDAARICMQSYRVEALSEAERTALLRRPAIKSEAVINLVKPILSAVKTRGDAALLELTAKFDRATLSSPVRHPPFVNDSVLAAIKPEVKVAIDTAYANIYAFHAAQKKVGGNVSTAGSGGVSGMVPGTGEDADDAVLEMETMPGVVCRRFARPISRVGLYVPGGSAVLPSTALMLGIPAQVARCPLIVLATPPRPDGSIAPEVLYVADKVGANVLLCAGGAQAVGAMAYGTSSVPKVDKIVGPGNQFVTAAKMLVQNETDALVSIDMPAGPSEVLVIADGAAHPSFVASDLLSQAEHGPDSQVVLVGISLSDDQLAAIEAELEKQALALPRVDVVRQAIAKSVTVIVPTREAALAWSNEYAPEHLIIQTKEPEVLAKGVVNAGSIFVGQWSPESCGDYASGTNHTLPTYGFARQYSGVSTSTFEKHITSQALTADGLALLGPHVVHLAECEGLEAHANAVRLRLKQMQSQK